ncbi:ABC transporter substrate-binding protein [Paenibacillus yanchengensis]|uniref:ABC transporter substrate-binding protein n=1 Tax=Paenibacillus yanchengensis TaxID=2035833 RepID=A0ABW4YJR2_9BACL
MKRRRLTIFFVAALVLLTILSGCNKGDSGKQLVRIGEVTRSLFYAPQYVAIEKGFFAEEGLQIDLTTTPGGDKTMTALLSNAIDVALVGSETSIYVYLQGADDKVINFAQLTQTDGTFLVARTEEEPFDWSNVAGTEFLGQRVGGMPQMVGEFVLKKHQIDPKLDLELIQNVDYGNIPAAFASGTGDYVQLFEPTASIFEREGTGKVVASFGTESGLLPYTAFMARESYITKNEAIIQSFTNAIYKAQQWIISADATEIAEVVTPYFDGVDADIMISSIDRYKQQASYAENPYIDELEWNNLLDVMSSANELKGDVQYGEIVNMKFAEQVLDEVSSK